MALRGDKQTLADGDTFFAGVNMRLDPAALEPGVCAAARNKRFRNGVAETRLGVIKPAWANNLHPETTGNQILPFSTIHGSGIYRDPNSTVEAWVMATESGVYYTHETNTPQKMSLPAAVVIKSPVTFLQAFNKLIMFRGTSLAPLIMTGLDDGFTDMIPQWDSTKSDYAEDDEVAYGPYISVGDDSGTLKMTRSGSTVTVTTESYHYYQTGSDVTITGASETAYNGRWSITVTDQDTFTFDIGTATPNTPATGTVKVSNNRQYWKAGSSTPGAGESPDTHPSKWTQVSNVLPNADSGAFIGGRVVVSTSFDQDTKTYAKRDFVFASDVLDEKHVFFSSQFRINQGAADELIDLAVLNENQLVCFKDRSVHVLTGFKATAAAQAGFDALETSMSLQTLIPNYGIPAPRAWAVVGPDLVFYAGRRGIVSMTQTEQSKLQGVEQALSDPIQPLIDRIDPRNESLIRIAYWNNALYVACPLDDGRDGNNACLVFDYLNKQWAGYDDGPAGNIKEFIKASYAGAERLFFIDTNGYVNLVEESWEGDEVASTATASKLEIQNISDMVRTRGYKHVDLNMRFFKTARMNVGTWNPKYTASLIMDGVEESTTLVADRTKSNTSYYRPFNKEEWVNNNENSDHNSPYREDYSFDSSAAKVRLLDNILLEDGSSNLLLENGGAVMQESETTVTGVYFGDLLPSRVQETLEPFPLSKREGRYGQLEISNTQGRLLLKQAVMTTDTGSRAIQVKS